MLTDEEDLSDVDGLLRGIGYRCEKRIGEGTFSSVYSAIRLRDGARLAVKRLIPTASPSRILLEVGSLASAKGLNNVIPLEFVHRIGGDVLLGMPYVPSTPKFSELILVMDLEEMKSYLKNLFIALAYIHDLGIIHRDIKPANFLYDRRHKRYALCDFGLAQKLKSRKRKQTDTPSCSSGCPSPKSKRTVLAQMNRNTTSSPATPTKKTPARTDQKDAVVIRTPPRSIKPLEASSTALRRSPRKHPSSQLHYKRHSKLKISGSAIIGSGQTMSNFTMLEPTSGILSLEPTLQPSLTSRLSLGGPSSAPSTPKVIEQCSCYGTPRVCPSCLSLKPLKAPRAGTPGFRPPEVLLKVEHQTTAVDIWAVGIIMLCILSRSYPFFHAPDDVMALAEITVLFGTEAVSKAANSYGRRFYFEPVTTGVNLQKLCHNLCRREPRDPLGLPCQATDEAIAFLKETLALVYSERISAKNALSHPFLASAS